MIFLLPSLTPEGELSLPPEASTPVGTTVAEGVVVATRVFVLEKTRLPDVTTTTTVPVGNTVGVGVAVMEMIEVEGPAAALLVGAGCVDAPLLSVDGAAEETGFELGGAADDGAAEVEGEGLSLDGEGWLSLVDGEGGAEDGGTLIEVTGVGAAEVGMFALALGLGGFDVGLGEAPDASWRMRRAWWLACGHSRPQALVEAATARTAVRRAVECIVTSTVKRRCNRERTEEGEVDAGDGGGCGPL